LIPEKDSKVDTGAAKLPRSGSVTPGSTLDQNVKLIAAAYLRAAHAYMLISMPTGTSTILGVFQAILALLPNSKPGRISVLGDKLIGIEKFASEIFCHKSGRFGCCIAK
jgi:hypothetical protein